MALSRNCLMAEIDNELEKDYFNRKIKKQEILKRTKSNIIIHSYGL